MGDWEKDNSLVGENCESENSVPKRIEDGECVCVDNTWQECGAANRWLSPAASPTSSPAGPHCIKLPYPHTTGSSRRVFFQSLARRTNTFFACRACLRATVPRLAQSSEKTVRPLAVEQCVPGFGKRSGMSTFSPVQHASCAIDFSDGLAKFTACSFV